MNEAIVLLLLLWAVLLLPSALRSRKSSPHATVGGFERAMDVLRAKPGHGRELMVPGDAGRIVTRNSARQAAEPGAPTEDPVVARRRSWFLRLVAGTGVSLLLAIGLGGWLWLPFVSLALLTGGYTALLRHLKLQRDQARQVVRDLEVRRADDTPSADPEVPPAHERATVDAGNLALQSVRLRRWDG